MDLSSCGRQQKLKNKFENRRLSRYLTQQGRIHQHNQFLQRTTDDEDLLGYEQGSGASDMQGDATENGNPLDTEDVQRQVCCTLGRASSTQLNTCDPKPYIRIVKQNIRDKFISEQLGVEPTPQSSDSVASTYKCVLQHKKTFEKCCLASKTTGIRHKQSRIHRRRTNHRNRQRLQRNP